MTTHYEDWAAAMVVAAELRLPLATGVFVSRLTLTEIKEAVSDRRLRVRAAVLLANGYYC